MNDHIVKSYDEELKALENKIVQMGGIVEANLADAMTALGRRDTALAQAVVANDLKIDALNADVDDMVVRVLALRQPVASDLRTVVAALRIAGDLERIGDYAANVAKRTIALVTLSPGRATQGIPRMGKMVQQILKDVIDAYIERDADKARRVWERDEDVDEMYTSLFRELLTYMMEDPRNISACTHALFMAKNVERMGDHATNVAETVYFLVHGKPLSGIRPKGDNTSFTVIENPGAPQGGTQGGPQGTPGTEPERKPA